MRRTRGNQEVASASKDDLAIKIDTGGDEIKRKPVTNNIAKQEHVRLGRTKAYGHLFGHWHVRRPSNDSDV